MKTLLIVVTWLQAGPVATTMPLESRAACRAAAEKIVRSIQSSAARNMTSLHQELVIERHDREMTWAAVTRQGREVVRVECGAIQ